MAFNINLPQKHERYNNRAAFPQTGDAKILYVANDTNKLYTYANSTYTEVDKELASSWGSLSQAPKGSAISVSKSDVGLDNVDNTTDADKPISTATQTALNLKVDKIAGKGLSTNDYTTTEQTKLAGIAAGAEVNVNADWNAVSGDAQILNKPTIPSISGLATTSYVDSQDATKQNVLVSGTNIKTINGSSVLGSGNLTISGGVSSVGADYPLSTTNGANPVLSIRAVDELEDGYLRSADWNTFNNKQDLLSSGTNIKTINGNDILGSGNVSVQPTLVSGTNIKTVNSTSLLGSGNVAVQPTLVSGTNIKTINGNSVLGSGDLVVGGGGGGIHAIVKPQTGNQVTALTSATNTGFTTSSNAFAIRAFPFYPATSFTSSSLTLNVTTLFVGGIARLLIYSDVNGKPSAKLYESADLDCSTTGLKTASTTFNFVAGTRYWLAVQTNSATMQFTSHPITFSAIIASFGLATRFNHYALSSIAIGSAPATWTGGTLQNFDFPFVYITSA